MLSFDGLEEVPVAGHDLDLDVLLLGHASEVGDDVVRLVALDPVDGYLQDLQDLLDQGTCDEKLSGALLRLLL